MDFIQRSVTTQAPQERFTGDVWFDSVYRGEDAQSARVNIGRFSPGARTFWHRHIRGQRLYVLAGVALIGGRDGRIIEAYPGETVDCDPGEEHWHGAAPDSFMEHLAVWEADDARGPDTDWLEEVTEAQYQATRSRGWEYEESVRQETQP